VVKLYGRGEAAKVCKVAQRPSLRVGVENNFRVGRRLKCVPSEREKKKLDENRFFLFPFLIDEEISQDQKSSS
jgi:hypothetical protein